MTSSLPVPADRLEVLEADMLHLVETAAPTLSPEHRAAMDQVWAKAVQANPDLFDGPAVLCTATGYDGNTLVLSWAPVSYRRFALRRVPGAPRVSSVFVTVAQPTDAGGLIVGRMSASTAAPGRWQLPGGNVEPPVGAGLLDETELRRQACRELAKEVGVDVTPQALTLWAVTRGEHGNIGVHFEAPPLPEHTVRERYEALVAAETASGRTPELDRITVVDGPATELEGPRADYLEALLHRRTGRTHD
ncbi:NUDIX hydrolase [Streptomyces sp. NRRL WC-3742]|uniref:NUDIX hydrolase n=1 Tax=Streptomyces sp. NRRL WC-3742 TaxID=1463934 RepID=UPI000B1A8F78|nr:NUDIX domain-containing protein [Streptomyces sp. NRRL WC-3742]